MICISEAIDSKIAPCTGLSESLPPKGLTVTSVGSNLDFNCRINILEMLDDRKAVVSAYGISVVATQDNSL
jgi:hypothetical protein